MQRTELSEARTDTRQVEVESGWDTVGGVPNGAYLITLALRAAEESLPGSVPLTVTGHFLRPGAHGPAGVTVEVVKQGRSTSTVTAVLEQKGKERLRLLATFGAPELLEGPTIFAPHPPEIPRPDQCVVPPRAAAAALGATLADRYEYRLVPPSRWLGAEAGEPNLDAWIRFADGRDVDLVALVLFADAFPGAVLEAVDGMAPTLELTVHLRHQPTAGWIQVRTSCRMLAGGLAEQDVELWDSRGQLVAMSRQLMAHVAPDGRAGADKLVRVKVG